MAHRLSWPRTAMVVTLIMTVGFLVACGGDEGNDGTQASDGTVAVTLQEFAIATDPASASAGSVTFDLSNEGPKDTHEFVVISTDLGPTELPTAKDGSVDETGEGMEVIDEVEDVPVGATESLTVDLEAGNYVLICNIVEEEDGKVESHYQEGMRTSFTVS